MPEKTARNAAKKRADSTSTGDRAVYQLVADFIAAPIARAIVWVFVHTLLAIKLLIAKLLLL